MLRTVGGACTHSCMGAHTASLALEEDALHRYALLQSSPARTHLYRVVSNAVWPRSILTPRVPLHILQAPARRPAAAAGAAPVPRVAAVGAAARGAASGRRIDEWVVPRVQRVAEGPDAEDQHLSCYVDGPLAAACGGGVVLAGRLRL